MRTDPSAQLAAAGVLIALACGAVEYPARGVVRDVQPETGQVLIEHEDVPGLMPAMTMNFDVADRALLAEIEPGQTIDFRIAHRGSAYVITRIEPIGRSGGAADAGPAGDAGVAGSRFDRLRGVDDPAPEFSLQDQNGDRFALSALRGRAVLLDFVYTSCPGPCPIQTGTHVEVQRRLSPGLRDRSWFVSVSLDPLRDTPGALRDYARARGADLANWSFLTGPPEEVASVVRAYGVGTLREPDGQIDHMVVTYLIDPRGRVAKRYLGLDHEADELARDLGSLLD